MKVNGRGCPPGEADVNVNQGRFDNEVAEHMAPHKPVRYGSGEGVRWTTLVCCARIYVTKAALSTGSSFVSRASEKTNGIRSDGTDRADQRSIPRLRR
jgi:hypothetical protein